MPDPRLHILGLQKEKRTAWLFVLPALMLVVCVYAYPIITTLVYSVTSIDIATYTIKEFVGFRNFQYIISNEFFSPTLMRTIYFGMMVVVMTILLAIGVSLLINIDFKGNKILRILILLPWAVPPVVSGVMWSQMFQYEYGFVNKIIKIFGGEGDTIWLGSPRLALHVLIITEIWRWLPFATLFIYAALQTIPRSVIEAAALDGAGYLKTVKGVILPIIFPGIIPVAIFLFVSAMKAFDTIFVLTAGGPRSGTTTLNYLVYLQGFQQFKFGRAAASAYILTALILFVIFVMFLLTRLASQRREMND